MKQTELYAKLQETWVAETNLKEGDSVAVIKEFDELELGFSYLTGDANNYIGEIIKVSLIEKDSILLDNGCRYPFFSLIKVNMGPLYNCQSTYKSHMHKVKSTFYICDVCGYVTGKESTDCPACSD